MVSATDHAWRRITSPNRGEAFSSVGSSYFFGFELLRADAEFFAPVTHQKTELANAHIADFVHPNQHRCPDRQASMANLADHRRGNFQRPRQGSVIFQMQDADEMVEQVIRIVGGFGRQLGTRGWHSRLLFVGNILNLTNSNYEVKLLGGIFQKRNLTLAQQGGAKVPSAKLILPWDNIFLPRFAASIASVGALDRFELRVASSAHDRSRAVAFGTSGPACSSTAAISSVKTT
jgi:hypothetical protein